MTNPNPSSWTRRAVVGTGLALFAVPHALAAPARPKMTTYRSPTCGCCGKWVDAARAAGFDVTVVPTADMQQVKAKAGVPDALLSCHTSTIGGYVVEGHVPLDAVRKLLREKPRVRGIAVPGMPLGSPGMEVHGAGSEPFDVVAFAADGTVRTFVKG